MSILKRNKDGKLKPDWGVIVTLILFLLGGGASSLGAYYAIKADISQQGYRLKIQEEKTTSIELTVNNMRMKDAGDTSNFNNLCASISEIKAQLKEIRDDQKRKQRKE